MSQSAGSYNKDAWDNKIAELEKRGKENTASAQQALNSAVEKIKARNEQNKKAFEDTCIAKKECHDIRDKMHNTVMKLEIQDLSELKPPSLEIKALTCGLDGTVGEVGLESKEIKQASTASQQQPPQPSQSQPQPLQSQLPQPQPRKPASHFSGGFRELVMRRYF